MFGDEPLLGKLIEDSRRRQYRVIGVIDEFYNPYGWPIHEYAVFFANRSRGYEGGAAYLVRTEPGQAAAVAKAIEDALLAANAGRNLSVRTIDEIKAQFFGPQRRGLDAHEAGSIVLLVLVTSPRHRGGDVVLGRGAHAPDRHPARARRAQARHRALLPGSRTGW